MSSPTTVHHFSGFLIPFALVVASSPAHAGEHETESNLAPPVASPWLEEVAGVVSQLRIALYGYVKVDAAYDTAALAGGDFADYVQKGSAGDGQFHLTARQTRLGLKIDGPESETVTSTALIEVDFYGGTEANSSTPRMRHAYLDLDFPEHEFSIRAGQTADVVSPLVPPTVNYQAGWNQGDIGFHRNQLRMTKGYQVGTNERLIMAAAATRANDAESVGRPGVQGRMAIAFEGLAGRETTVGVSGHEAPTVGLLSSRSLCADLTLPLGANTTLQGEFYDGRNLETYLGGIATGTANVETTGFWASLSYEACANWSFHGGYAIDDPDPADIANGEMTSNAKVWTNANYAIDSATTVSVEVAEHTTGYKAAADEEATRFQFALTFRF